MIFFIDTCEIGSLGVSVFEKQLSDCPAQLFALDNAKKGPAFTLSNDRLTVTKTGESEDVWPHSYQVGRILMTSCEGSS